jgi:hypothetical protein
MRKFLSPASSWRSTPRAWTGMAFAALGLALALVPAVARWRACGDACGRIDRVGGGATCASTEALALLPRERTLASWATVGGCGAGSATGIGGVKWIGRSVRGGLFQVQCQANYLRLSDGYSYTVNNQITADLGEKWNAGVVVPYLYKYVSDPLMLREFHAGFDVSNAGLGDVNLLLTRRLGAINATTVTASLGLPTGTHDAMINNVNYLPQDRQLGAGKVSGGLLIDHVIDNIWGPVVLGGALSYPGAQNDLENYRAPSASVYAYAGYLLGPVVPAAGISATAFKDHDRDRGQDSDRALQIAAINGSLEWSNPWVAVLAGVSLPFSRNGREPWTLGMGLVFAPF